MVKWVNRILLSSLLIALIAASIFYYQGWREKKKLTDAVSKYNSIKEEVYERWNADLLEPYATAREKKKVSMYLMYLQYEQNIKMETTLEKIDFLTVKDEKQKGRVKTKEKWRFRYLEYDSGKEKIPWKEVLYTNEYVLTKSNGRWIVEEIKVNKQSLQDMKK